jgi:hypothetical protein
MSAVISPPPPAHLPSSGVEGWATRLVGNQSSSFYPDCPSLLPHVCPSLSPARLPSLGFLGPATWPAGSLHLHATSTPLPPQSSMAPSWASTVREGLRASLETQPIPSADVMSLDDRCVTSGLCASVTCNNNSCYDKVSTTCRLAVPPLTTSIITSQHCRRVTIAELWLPLLVKKPPHCHPHSSHLHHHSSNFLLLQTFIWF